MAIDSYMYFQDYQGNYLKSESQVDLKKNGDQDDLYNPFKAAFDAKGLFEVEDYSFDVEQTLNIGSQSSGAGAGRITFNPFSITRKIDVSSNIFFSNACSGKSFKQVVNETLLSGLQQKAGRKPQAYRLKPASLGAPLAGVNLDKALRLADELEDMSLSAKLEQRK